METPRSCRHEIASANYYVERHNDFVARHSDLAPPPYYLEYGVRYFNRFHELRESLSTEGKAWVDRTARFLQEQLEEAVHASPLAFEALERDHEAFRHFAYATHPEAYLKGGLETLPADDLLVVVGAPDLPDILSHDGINQIVRTAIGYIERNGSVRNEHQVRAAIHNVRATFRRDILGGLRAVEKGAIAVVEAGKVATDLVLEQVGLVAKSPKWVMRQTWQTPLFCSWRVSVESVRAQLPPGLEPDLFDGSAWISLVPLAMAGVGLISPNLPRLPTFSEVNLRTYVRCNGVPGVHFISLECGETMVDLGGKLLFGLPYNQAHVSIRRYGDEFRCESRRGAAILRCRYEPRGAAFVATPGSLEQFLTERYAMFVLDTKTGQMRRGDVLHEPWLLQAAEVEIETNTIPASFGLQISGAPDHVGFSVGVDTDTYPLRIVT